MLRNSKVVKCLCNDTCVTLVAVVPNDLKQLDALTVTVSKFSTVNSTLVLLWLICLWAAKLFCDMMYYSQRQMQPDSRARLLFLCLSVSVLAYSSVLFCGSHATHTHTDSLVWFEISISLKWNLNSEVSADRSWCYALCWWGGQTKLAEWAQTCSLRRSSEGLFKTKCLVQRNVTLFCFSVTTLKSLIVTDLFVIIRNNTSIVCYGMALAMILGLWSWSGSILLVSVMVS